MKDFTWQLVAVFFIVALGAVYFNESGWKGLEESKEPMKEITTWLINLKSGKGNEKNLTSISFWTPSAETAVAWREYEAKGKEIPDKDRWESAVTESDIVEFQEKIASLPGFAGFRRLDSTGKGRGIVKPGYWWTVTTNKEFNFTTLRTSYYELCGCDDAYFEFVTTSKVTYESLNNPIAP